ncbi:MAG: penicillin-binding protein 2 [Clostridia bacterium]|nr:penicillin-binding protein 2 [Clostridia bacterium]
MKKTSKQINKQNINLRFNITTILTYIVGCILIIQLFNLQIVHGNEYREQSNTRLTRESVLEATRGEILDKTGNILVTSQMCFSLELYKSKIDNQALNDTILRMVNVLEKYEVPYTDNFPIKIDPIEYKISNEELASWKKNNGFSDDTQAEDAFNVYKTKYKITNNDISEIRKIIAIRYSITKTGYSSTKALTIAKKIPREAVAEFTENSDLYPGINITIEPVRKYTSGNLASHILGYASKINDAEYQERKDTYSPNDIIGKNGIEKVFEEYLKGKNGVKQIDMAVDGTITAEYTAEEAISGSNVILTLDSNLQRITENALEENIQKIRDGGFGKYYEAKSGTCVVMNVKTGEVLAMASYPNYNPQLFVDGISTEDWKNYTEDNLKPLVNKSVQNSYAPGSIFKMVSAISALESGVVSTTERINDVGVYTKYKPYKNCWKFTDYGSGHGWLNISDAIKHSCNYFFYEVGDRMGISNLEKYAKYFGLGKKTGIELPSETAGVLAGKESSSKMKKGWSAGDTLNAVIGQGDNEFSSLQMAKYISMVANGGKKIDVTIIKGIQNADGTEVPRDEINKFVNKKLGLEEDNEEELEISQENLDAVLEGMKSVTNETGGTAYSIFRGFDIEVGGKTGSAEAGENVNAWFAGFAPFDNPEIAVVVMVENGGHGYYTAEAVRKIIAEYFGMNTEDISEDMKAIPYTEILE